MGAMARGERHQNNPMQLKIEDKFMPFKPYDSILLPFKGARNHSP